MTNLTTTHFHGLELTLIHHQNQKWLTAKQVGQALGYAEGNARQGIINLFNRHADEFTEKDTCEINLMTQGQGRETRIFSASGCHLLGFFANTARAKAFRQWAKQVLAGEAAPGQAVPTRSRLAPVRVNRTMERQLLEAFVGWQGSQKSLAKHFGISQATANLIIYGKYQFSPAAGVGECSPELLDAVADKILRQEQARLLGYQQSLANRLRSSAGNSELTTRLDAIGQHLQQHPAQALLPPQGGAQ